MKLYFRTLAATSCRRERLGRRAILADRASSDTNRRRLLRIVGRRHRSPRSPERGHRMAPVAAFARTRAGHRMPNPRWLPVSGRHYQASPGRPADWNPGCTGRRPAPLLVTASPRRLHGQNCSDHEKDKRGEPKVIAEVPAESESLQQRNGPKRAGDEARDGSGTAVTLKENPDTKPENGVRGPDSYERPARRISFEQRHTANADFQEEGLKTEQPGRRVRSRNLYG
jgi:hypothetical protein